MARTGRPRAPGFTAKEVIRAVPGLAYQTLSYWVRSGVVTPSVAQGKGKGTRRLFALPEVVALRAIVELRAAGISLQGLRKASRLLDRNRKASVHPLASHHLVIVPGRQRSDLAVEIVDNVGLHLESVVQSPGQRMMTSVILPLKALADDVRNITSLIVAERTAKRDEMRARKNAYDREFIRTQREKFRSVNANQRGERIAG